MRARTEAMTVGAERAAPTRRHPGAAGEPRPTTAAFPPPLAHRKTFIRNRLSFWRHDTVRIKIDDGVDEIALGLMVDAHARTELSRVITVGDGFAQSRRGLRLMPDAPAADGTREPSATRRRERSTASSRASRRARRCDRGFRGAVMEYPWCGPRAEPVQH